MTKTNTCPCYRTVPDSRKCVRAPVEITGNGLAADFQLVYFKTCGYFLQWPFRLSKVKDYFLQKS